MSAQQTQNESTYFELVLDTTVADVPEKESETTSYKKSFYIAPWIKVAYIIQARNILFGSAKLRPNINNVDEYEWVDEGVTNEDFWV